MGASLAVAAATLLVMVPAALGQFPAVCAGNATTPDAVCCPTPPGLHVPCGGPGRGRCMMMSNDVDVTSPGAPDDMRLQWPLNFFQHACACDGHYGGYMCHECKYGYTGHTCNKKIRTFRKNVVKLSPQERVQLQQVFNKAKTSKSDFVILKNIHGVSQNGALRFTETTVYDFFTFLLYYSSNFHSAASVGHPGVDFSHGGPAYLPWHRALLLMFERELQRLAGDPSFTLPYWSWMGASTQCTVCSNDLMASTNFSDPSRSLDRHSVFSNWHTWQPSDLTPSKSGVKHKPWLHKPDLIIRGVPIPDDPHHSASGSESSPMPNGEPVVALPSTEAIQAVFRERLYDLDPGDPRGIGFRAAMEGQPAVWQGTKLQKPSTMSQQVHVFMNGTMTDVLTSANDPAFFLHYAFLDLLFEIWIRSHQADDSVLAARSAPVGHRRYSALVPMFPVRRTADLMTDSRHLGYDYTELTSLAGAVHVPLPQASHEVGGDSLGLALTVAIGCVIALPLLLLASYCLVTSLLLPRPSTLRDPSSLASSKQPLLHHASSSSYCSCDDTPATRLPVQFYLQSQEEELDSHWTKQGYLPEPYAPVHRPRPPPLLLAV